MSRVLKIAFAANAMAFLGLLITFLAVFFLKGSEPAGRVWTSPYCYLAVWSISIAVCTKNLKV